MPAMNNKRTSSVSCPCCGATEFVEGEMATYGGMGFRPKGSSKLLAALLIGRLERIEARKCNACGNILLFARPR